MMNEQDTPYRLNMGIPNGIILSLIGVLVLITPLAKEMATRDVWMDVAAGVVLVGGGAASLIHGVKRQREIAREDQLRE